jgi:GNAT superfamily N-acetyltransferase
VKHDAHAKIRLMTGGDVPLLATWIPNVPLWRRYGLTAQAAAGQLNDALERDDLLVVADSEAGAICCGFAWCMPRGAFGRSAYLRWIGVRDDQTGTGLGTALLRHVEQAAADFAPDMILLVSDFNHDAQRFYERAGYRQVGALPGYVLPDVTELIFWKRLS